MKKKSRGAKRTLIVLQNPGVAVPDGDGGFTTSWYALTPATVYAAIDTPTARDLERLAAGTVISSALRTVTFDFHPQVTTATRLAWTDVFGRAHLASVTGVDNPEERCIETVCLCVELLSGEIGLPGGGAFLPAAFLPAAFNTGVAG